MDGLLIVDKPVGPTSHDVVARVRRVLGERRIGHTGTLDPMASGVLALVLGRATRLARFLSADDKAYDAEVRFGVATDTYDAQGAETTLRHAGPPPSRADIERALDTFRGTFMQQPPAYSAKKIDGKRSYALARANRHVPPASPAPPALPAPVTVTVHAIDVGGVHGDRVTLRVDCSAGFYVRALAHDLGERLGVGAHLVALRRTRIGDFTLADSVALDTLERTPAAAMAAVVPPEEMLPDMAAAILTEAGENHVAHGRDVGPDEVQELRAGAARRHRAGVRLIDRRGRLLGIANAATPSGLLHPSVVLM